MSLALIHDFLILTETRETATQRQLMLDSIPDGYAYFSSGIGARKGGIGLIIFLKTFQMHKWTVAMEGRVASLLLDGPQGSLNIFAVYLDPAPTAGQCNGTKALESSSRRMHITLLLEIGTLLNALQTELPKTLQTPESQTTVVQMYAFQM